MTKINFFTTEQENSILSGQNNELLLSNFISPYLRRYPILLYYNVETVNNDALQYLINKFNKYSAYQTSAKDKFYDFCTKRLRTYAKKLLKTSNICQK
jgi:hypothetical protein